jgi:hypothetical protein
MVAIVVTVFFVVEVVLHIDSSGTVKGCPAPAAFFRWDLRGYTGD